MSLPPIKSISLEVICITNLSLLATLKGFYWYLCPFSPTRIRVSNILLGPEILHPDKTTFRHNHIPGHQFIQNLSLQGWAIYSGFFITKHIQGCLSSFMIPLCFIMYLWCTVYTFDEPWKVLMRPFPCGRSVDSYIRCPFRFLKISMMRLLDYPYYLSSF